VVIDGENFLSMPTQEGYQGLDSDRASVMSGQQFSNGYRETALKN